MPWLFALALLAAPTPAWQGVKFPLPAIDRPLLLPDNTVELTLAGDLSAQQGLGGGESAALGVELGLGEGQAGLAVAIPAHPGLGFGSVAGSVAYAIARQAALRLDLAFDRSPGNGFRADANFYSAGAGVPFELRMGPWLALVGGRLGAVSFAHFVNFDAGGAGQYFGTSSLYGSSDLVVFVKEEDAGSQLALNLPLGLLVQVAPSVSIVLRSGYEAIITTGGGNGARHFIPLGLDATFSPTPMLDFAATVLLPGEIADSGTAFGHGYRDVVLAALVLRLRG